MDAILCGESDRLASTTSDFRRRRRTARRQEQRENEDEQELEFHDFFLFEDGLLRGLFNQ
jgi:hypothetical protein